MPEEQKKRKGRKKVLRIILIILACLVVLAGVTVLVNRQASKAYFSCAEKAFTYPELKDGFIPQGIHYDKETDCFFITGYKAKHTPSPVYVVRRSDGQLMASASLMTEDGSINDAHCGGIACYGDYLYLTSGFRGMYIYSRSDVLHAKEGEEIRELGHFQFEYGGEVFKPSFCTVHDGMLMIGEFYFPVILSSPKNHHFETPAGDHTKALALNFRLDTEKAFGIDMDPVSAYTLPERAQGIWFADGKFLVSQSFAPVPSKIRVYDYDKAERFADFDGIPVYALDQSVETAEWTLPPFAEELEYLDGNLLTMSEAATVECLIGKLMGMEWCYRIKPGQGSFLLDRS